MQHQARTQLAASRRGFLGMAGGIATGAAVYAISGGQSAKAEEASAESHAGYRETDHIKTVYALARF